MNPKLMLDEIDEAAFFRHRAQVQAEILNYLPDGVLVADDAGRILMVNETLCLFTGYEEEELRFKDLSVLLPEKYRRGHTEWVRHFSSHPETPPRHMGEAVTPFPLLKKDGSTAPVDIAIRRMTSHVGRLSVAVIRWVLPE